MPPLTDNPVAVRPDDTPCALASLSFRGALALMATAAATAAAVAHCAFTQRPSTDEGLRRVMHVLHGMPLVLNLFCQGPQRRCQQAPRSRRAATRLTRLEGR